ncbi:MAG: Holliday junction resolvase RuvX [Acidobacteriota bacterium]|nr:Holliday junction resolvase RuvX [Acidobacteriota bacterium]
MKTSGRILALDLGAKRIGVAVTDELQMTARGVSVFTRETTEKLLAAVQKLIEDFDAVALVIGLPLNFDGSESAGAIDARAIADYLTQNLSIPVYLQDERLTSREAEENLRERGFNQKEIKKLVDQEAAAIILNDFLAMNTSNAN